MSFQEILDEAETSLDKTINYDVATLLKKVEASVAVAETITEGVIMRRFLNLPSLTSPVTCSIVCTHPSSLINLGEVQVSSVKNHDFAQISSELAKGLFRKTNASVCIGCSGILGSPDSSGYYESKCYFSFLIQGQLFQKYILASGDKDAVLSTLSQACFVFLKHILEVGFDLLPEEENDGRE